VRKELIKTYHTTSIEDLPDIAKDLIAVRQHRILLLIGELGAGKTTLVKQLLVALGSEDVGSSPSYSLINEYKKGEGKIYHLDLYRLNSAEEAFALGLEEILYSGHTCLIEWPQLVLDYLETPFNVVEISLIADGHREIKLSRVES